MCEVLVTRIVKFEYALIPKRYGVEYNKIKVTFLSLFSCPSAWVCLYVEIKIESWWEKSKFEHSKFTYLMRCWA